MKMKLVLFLAACASVIKADIYFHNPRGSNNRLDESSRARSNENRLFNSQNNDRGGYNVGSMYYFAGSKLQLEWSNQHSCGNPNANCEIVLQYMCDDSIRDGRTTRRIPIDLEDKDDLKFGMHEDIYHYAKCRIRQRNKGLYTADQELDGEQSIYTRQSPGGDRYGFECPEERDYYPYWHTSPWKDIAVLTNDVSRCEYYQQESQNVKERWECVVVDFESLLPQLTPQIANRIELPNNKEDCENFRFRGITTTWTRMPSHGIAPPDCQKTQYTRDNHHGNTYGGYPVNYNWTVPDDISESCALRVRYNISTNDFDPWKTDASNNGPGGVQLAKKFGLSSEEAQDQGYVFENDPQVKIFDDPELGNKFRLRLAVNTAQFGRTFQDRTHSFAIRARSEDLSDSSNIIHNVNVRGKRGNIVQVYPSVEYDFVPNTLQLDTGAGVQHWIHFQWTGSDTNPRGNTGEGPAGTDRSNMVLLADQAYPEGRNKSESTIGQWGRSYPRRLDTTDTELTKLAFATSDPYRTGRDPLLANTNAYFDLMPLKMDQRGLYYYFCTRNNNFSNRSQKGRLIIN